MRNKMAIISDKELSAEDKMLWAKMMRTAGFEDHEWADFGLENKDETWKQMKRDNYKMIAVLGAEAARTILKLKRSVLFEPLINKLHWVQYLPAHVLIVPFYHPNKLLAGRQKDIDEGIEMLRNCKRYLEGN